ncbi:MAG: hypothetical protein JSR55_04215 [Proteobacteria bacterium]|nr:hypothetical protein [Pseudomonadota bacterium]
MVALAPAAARGANTGDISLWRINLLRLGYFIMAGGMGSIIVPAFLHHRPWEFTHGVMNSMLLAMAVLALLGLRYPLKMLPLVFWEMIWKIVWLGAIAYPAWRNGTMDAGMEANLFPCALVAIFLVIVPWDYVWRNFAAAKSDRLW